MSFRRLLLNIPALRRTGAGGAPPDPSLISAPFITGVGATGEILTINSGEWLSITTLAVSLRYVSDDTEIDTFSGDGTYEVQIADEGEAVYVHVVPDGNEALSVDSDDLQIYAPVVSTGAPSIIGSNGGTLTYNPGTFTGTSVTVTKQWQSDGVDIPGATGDTLASAQYQYTDISLYEIGTNPISSDTSADSNVILAIPLFVTATDLANGAADVAGTRTIVVNDADTIVILTGSLPAGMTFTDNGGVDADLDWTTSDPANITLTLRAANAQGVYVDQVYTLRIALAAAVITAPTASQHLTATLSAVTVNAVANKDNYQFQITTIEDTGFVNSLVLNVTQAAATLNTGIPAMPNATAYRVRVRALSDTLLAGAWSSVIAFYVLTFTYQIEFATDDASPLTTPYTGEIGTLETVDTQNRAEAASGSYHVSSNTTSTALGHSADIGRTSGRVVHIQYTRTSGAAVLRRASTLAAATAPTSSVHSVNISDGSIGDQSTTVAAPAIGTTLQTRHHMWLIELATGAICLTSPDDTPANIELFWVWFDSADTDGNNQFNCGGTSEYFIDYWHEFTLPADADWSDTKFRALSVTPPVSTTVYTGTDDDGISVLKFTLPVSPTTGNAVEMRRGTSSTYYITRFYYNGTTWECRIRTVTNNGAEATIGTDVTDIGTPDTMIVWKKGNARSVYTKVGTAAPIRRVASASSTIGATSLDVAVVTTGSGWTLASLWGYPMQSALYQRLMSNNMVGITAATFTPGSTVTQNTAVPTLAGGNRVGETITITPGVWTGSPSITRHLFSGVTDRGAVTTSYVIDIADLGTDLTVVETDSVSATSAVSAPLTIVAWAAPTISAPDDQEELYAYTPTLTWSAVSGFSASADPTYEREVRSTFNGIPTTIGLTGTSSVLDELVENLSVYQIRVRAGAGGDWSAPITIKTHVSDFRDLSSDDAAAPISTHAADIVGQIDVTSTAASVSRTGGKTHIAVVSSGQQAYVWTHDPFVRAHNRVWVSKVVTSDQGGRMGLAGSQIAAPTVGSLQVSAKPRLPQVLYNNVSSLTLASHNANGGIGDRSAFIPFPEGGAAYWWHAIDDLVWHFGGIAQRGSSDPMYMCLGGISAAGNTMDIDEGDVIEISSGTFSQPFDWANLYTTSPGLNSSYEGAANGWVQLRFVIPASGTVRLRYRLFDATSYRFLELSGTTVVAKMCVNSVDTAYSTPVSIASVGAVGDSISIHISMYNSREYYGVFNHTTGVYKSSNQTSNQSFNNGNSGVMITSTGTPTLTSLLAAANSDDRYSALDLPALTETTSFMGMSVSEIQRTFVDSVTGHTHLIVGFRNANFTIDPMDLFDVDLTSAVVLHKKTALGRTNDSANLIWDQANQYIYGWTTDSSYFWRWALGGNTQVITPTTALPNGAYFYKGVMSQETPPKAYITTYGVLNGESRLFVYNPATVTLANLGSPSGGSFAAEWGYHIEANANYVFIAMGQTPWYLTIYNINTPGFTSYYTGENASSGEVRCNIARTIFYFKKIVGGVSTWYDITDGSPGVVSAPSDASLQPLKNIGSTIPVPGQSDSVVFDFADGDAYDGHDPVVLWTRTGQSQQSADLTSIDLAPADIKRIIDYDADNLLVEMEFYGPLVIYNKDTGIKTVPGVPPYSIYGVMKLPSGAFHFTGYPSIGLLEWDTTQPWTLNSGSPPPPAATNPARPYTAGTHGYYVVLGSDGNTYQASQHERDDSGGELVQYTNPAGVITRLELPLYDPPPAGAGLDGWEPYGLAAVGTRIVYSGVGIGPTFGGDDAKLFVCTVGGFPTIENEWSIAGKTNLGFLIPVSSTEVVGMVALSGFVYRMNITNGTVVWSATLAETIFSGGFFYDFRPFYDGTRIWFGMGDAIYSFDPTVDPDTTAPVKLVDIGAAVNVHIVDGIAHVYNGKIKYEYPV